MEPTTPVVAKEWIPQLVKELNRIVNRRRLEIDRLNEVFRFDPRDLARRYVEPYVQFTNPADHVGQPPAIRQRPERLQMWVDRFLRVEVRERDGRHVLFLLGDAGMGKTSALLMLRLWHMTSFWPQHLSMHLLKLGPDTLEQIAAIAKKRNTVLLLDALDEDPEARDRVEARLEALLQATDAFRNVVLTCRTQFFPRGGPAPIESPGKVEIAGYVCNMLYLSPFFDDQVDEYLERAFPNRWLRWVWSRLGGRDNRDLRRARRLLKPMRDLRIRPLLLSYIEDLLDEGFLPEQRDSIGSYRVFDTLIKWWLVREERKIRRRKDPALADEPNVTREQLRHACRLLAFEMYRRQRWTLTLDDIGEFLDEHELRQLSVLDLGGRSLLNRTARGAEESAEGFRFAHRTIQEFLVVEHLGERARAGEQLEPLVATDEMLRFYLSAVREDPDFANLTPLLDARQVEDLASLIWPEGPSAGEGLDPQRWKFPGAHFRGADLRGHDLRELPLAGFSLAGADLSGADLSGADLSHCQVEGARFDRSVLDSVRWNAAKSGDVPHDLFRVVETPLDGVVPLWRTIPAGHGWIGSTDSEDGRDDDESPRHRVEVHAPFQLMCVPVTNAQFAAFDSEAADAERSDHPVVNVTCAQAVDFCKWLARLPGFAGARLPTEEEWEYACRAGTTTRFWSGDDEGDLAKVGWYDRNSQNRTHAVGEKPANPWGLYDMHGNVWEWTASRWKSDYSEQAAGLAVDPAGEPEDLADPRAGRVIRGGSYGNAADGARSACRRSRDPWNRWLYQGFRVVLPHPPAGG